MLSEINKVILKDQEELREEIELLKIYTEQQSIKIIDLYDEIDLLKKSIRNLKNIKTYSLDKKYNK